MNTDVILYDLEAQEEHQMQIALQKGSMQVSGTPSPLITKDNLEIQEGDFSTNNVFSMSLWNGTNDKNNVGGASGVYNWKPNLLYSNIKSTESFYRSNGIEIQKNDGILSLGWQQEEKTDTGKSFIYAEKSCSSIVAIEENTQSAYISEDSGLTFTEEVVADNPYLLYRYDKAAKLSIQKIGLQNIDRPGIATYGLFKNLTTQNITNNLRVTEGRIFGDIEYNPYNQLLRIKVSDSNNYGVGQVIKISGIIKSIDFDGSNTTSNYADNYYVAAIDDSNYIYLSSSKTKLVGDITQFNEGITDSDVMIIEKDSAKKLDFKKLQTVTVAQENGNAPKIVECIKDSEGYNDTDDNIFTKVFLDTSVEAPHGSCVVSPTNVSACFGLSIKNINVRDDGYTSFVIESGSVSDNEDGWVELNNQKLYHVRNSPHINIIAYKGQIVFTQDLAPDKYDGQLLYTLILSPTRVQYDTGTQQLDHTDWSFVGVHDERDNNITFQSTFTIEAITSLLTVDIASNDINEWRKGNKFIIDVGGTYYNYDSIMEYPNGDVKMVLSNAFAGTGAFEKRKSYQLPNIDTPTAIASDRDSAVCVGGKNKIYLYKNTKGATLHFSKKEYKGDDLYQEIELNKCDNIKEYITDIVYSDDIFYASSEIRDSLSNVIGGNVYAITKEGKFTTIAEFHEDSVVDIEYNQISKTLFIATGEFCYIITDPLSEKYTQKKELQGKIKRLERYKNGVLIVRENDSIHSLDSDGRLFDFCDSSETLVGSIPMGSEIISIGSNGKSYTADDSNTNAPLVGEIESSWYRGFSSGAQKHILYAKVNTLDMQDGDKIRMKIKTDDINYKYVPKNVKDPLVSNGVGDSKYESTLSDSSKGVHVFSFPANVRTGAFSYILEIEKGSQVNDPKVQHVSIEYILVEEKELKYTLSFQLIEKIQDNNLSPITQRNISKTKDALLKIWREKRTIQLEIAGKKSQFLVPYALQNDATGGYTETILNSRKEARDGCKQIEYIITMTFKALYPYEYNNI